MFEETITDFMDDDGYRRTYVGDHSIRDTGQYGPDEILTYVVSDIASLITISETISDKAKSKAILLDTEIHTLFEKSKRDDLSDEEFTDITEAIQWRYEEAENLEGISVDWDGENGTVLVTLTEFWTVLPGTLGTLLHEMKKIVPEAKLRIVNGEIQFQTGLTVAENDSEGILVPWKFDDWWAKLQGN